LLIAQAIVEKHEERENDLKVISKELEATGNTDEDVFKQLSFNMFSAEMLCPD